jgi:hypothetical protein
MTERPASCFRCYGVRLLFAFLVAGLIGAYALVGTPYQFFGPGSKRWALDAIHQRIEGCPANLVMIVWYQDRKLTDEELHWYNLSEDMHYVGGLHEGPGWFEFFTIKSLEHDGRRLMTPEQRAHLHKVIAAMPESDATTPVEKCLSVAINQDGKLRIYRYPLNFDGPNLLQKIPPEVLDISQ